MTNRNKCIRCKKRTFKGNSVYGFCDKCHTKFLTVLRTAIMWFKQIPTGKIQIMQDSKYLFGYFENVKKEVSVPTILNLRFKKKKEVSPRAPFPEKRGKLKSKR